MSNREHGLAPLEEAEMRLAVGGDNYCIGICCGPLIPAIAQAIWSVLSNPPPAASYVYAKVGST